MAIHTPEVFGRQGSSDLQGSRHSWRHDVKEVKEAMLERLGISVQQARKTLWLGKPKPEESPRTYWQPIIQAIAKLKRVITDPEKAAEELF